MLLTALIGVSCIAIGGARLYFAIARLRQPNWETKEQRGPFAEDLVRVVAQRRRSGEPLSDRQIVLISIAEASLSALFLVVGLYLLASTVV